MSFNEELALKTWTIEECWRTSAVTMSNHRSLFSRKRGEEEVFWWNVAETMRGGYWRGCLQTTLLALLNRKNPFIILYSLLFTTTVYYRHGIFPNLKVFSSQCASLQFGNLTQWDKRHEENAKKNPKCTIVSSPMQKTRSSRWILSKDVQIDWLTDREEKGKVQVGQSAYAQAF